MSAPHVTILYNEPVLPPDHRDAESEHEVLYTVDEVEAALRDGGLRVSRLGVRLDPSALADGLRRLRPDAVFNLFEGLADRNETEAHAAGILDWLGVPYTGCPFQALALARCKHLTKHLLRGAGVPTAEFFVVERGPVPDNPLGWPVIVKPATQDASVGLDQGSVVTGRGALEERVERLLREYGPPVLVEEFLPGREVNVGVVETPELTVLPPSEILFTSTEPGRWPIVTYDAKWRPGSPDYEATPPRYPADVTPGLRRRLEDVARRAFRLLGCRDYARVDFRVRGTRPYVLEVNPNPDFSPTAGLSGGLASAGIRWADFAVALAWRALGRATAAPPPQPAALAPTGPAA
jgi:D-alanine-D-alanine ligase